jgi:hypothetical protein
VSRLPDHAVHAGRIGRPENRADVMRILDAIEHHDERRPRRCRRDDLLDAVLLRRLELGDDSLVHAATRRPIERLCVHAIHRHPARVRKRQRLLDAAIAAVRDTQPAHDATAQRFEHGVEAVNDHQPNW